MADRETIADFFDFLGSIALYGVRRVFLIFREIDSVRYANGTIFVIYLLFLFDFSFWFFFEVLKTKKWQA